MPIRLNTTATQTTLRHAAASTRLHSLAYHRRGPVHVIHAFQIAMAAAPTNTIALRMCKTRITGSSREAELERLLTSGATTATHATSRTTVARIAKRISLCARAALPSSGNGARYRRRTAAAAGHAMSESASAVRPAISAGTSHTDDLHHGAGWNTMKGET